MIEPETRVTIQIAPLGTIGESNNFTKLDFSKFQVSDIHEVQFDVIEPPERPIDSTRISLAKTEYIVSF